MIFPSSERDCSGALRRPGSLAAAGSFAVGMVVGLVTWVPLVVLSAFQQVFMKGANLPFYQSFGTHARLLVTIPLMFVAEKWFDERVGAIVRELPRAGIVPSVELPRFAGVLRRAFRLVDSWLVEVGLAILTGILLTNGARVDLPVDLLTWRTVQASGSLTWAGKWYTFVSLPLFQFLVWRWCWRLLMWGWILWRTARLDLQLVPSHPDFAGGLGGLGMTQVSLSPLAFGLSGMLVAGHAENLLFAGTRLDTLALPLASIVVGGTALALAPLVFFAPKLLRVKEHGLLEYGALASDYTQAFQAKWIAGTGAQAQLLGTADLQSLADLANSFAVVRNMRLIPCAWDEALLIALSCIVPMAPLLLIALPLNDLMIRAARTMLGL